MAEISISWSPDSDLAIRRPPRSKSCPKDHRLLVTFVVNRCPLTIYSCSVTGTSWWILHSWLIEYFRHYPTTTMAKMFVALITIYLGDSNIEYYIINECFYNIGRERRWSHWVKCFVYGFLATVMSNAIIAYIYQYICDTYRLAIWWFSRYSQESRAWMNDYIPQNATSLMVWLLSIHSIDTCFWHRHPQMM